MNSAYSWAFGSRMSVETSASRIGLSDDIYYTAYSMNRQKNI